MTDLIEIIKNWPIIVQGALGSALFWAFLVAAQKLVIYGSEKYSYHTKQSRISWLVSATHKYMPVGEDGKEETLSIATLIYRSIRHFYKSMMWLALGLIINIFIHPFGVIGFIGSLYFLFKASEIVSPIEDGVDVERKLEELIQEWEYLKKET